MEMKEIAVKAIATAESWMKESVKHRSSFEINFGKTVASMLSNKNDKLLLIELLDQSFRADTPQRSIEQVRYVFNKYGMAQFFSTPQKFLVWMFLTFGGITPGLSMGMFENYLRDEVKGVVLKGEDNILFPHINMREEEGIRLNLNFIGEAVLGEEEAEHRRKQYVEAMESKEIKYVSIKASTIFSQISSLDYEKTVKNLKVHLARIYRAARDNTFINEKGETESKFINLDMEEYRDMEIVYEAFMQLLDEEEFHKLEAGIVIQAYIPDSFYWLKKLTEWGKKRATLGRAPIKIRLVKGANMEMEYIESSSKYWPMVTFEEKVDSDANYKKYLLHLLAPENACAVHVGVASHNIFEIAFAYEVAKANDTLKYVQFETLEGMVESIRQTIKKAGQKMVAYGPTSKKENFTNAIAYLVRRLDENTGDENFLRYSFGLDAGTPEWEKLKKIFNISIERMAKISNEPKRTQDRNKEPKYEKTDFSVYVSEVDTDFVLTQNRHWAETIAAKWKNIASEKIEIGSVIGGQEMKGGNKVVAYDKSVHPKKNVVGTYHLSDAEELKKAVDVAAEAYKEWSAVSIEEKLAIFDKARHLYRKHRGDLIGVAAAEVGKVFTETDVEVSEAIDFIYFYTHAMKTFMDQYPHLSFTGKGVCAVISPWNFPVAIPTGGIMTALASGNATIFKPASVATLTGRMLCDILWEAGVPKNVLQFVSARGGTVEDAIIRDPRVNACVFTGSEGTAYKILKARPDLLISAETGGKDGTIVTALADRDQAIKNILHSAFSNSGQKCSATSLLVLEDEVFNDKNFKATLKDSAESIKVGSVWDLGNKLGTMADLPSGDLKKAIEDKSSDWLIAPAFADDNPYMLKPAIKWGVERGSFFHMTELFGPVLTVMSAKDLKEAIDIVNETGYGLTSGLESLDEREWKVWADNLKAGNLYINRSTTGAIVLRQPFGGLRKSSVGLGRKAGTYNYVAQFTNIKDKEVAQGNGAASPIAAKIAKALEVDATLCEKISSNYAENVKTIFEIEVDYMKVRGEDNIFKYLKVPEVVVRYYEENKALDLARVIMAAQALNIPVTVSVDTETTEVTTKLAEAGINAVTEDENAFYSRFSSNIRVRYLDKASIKPEAYKAMYEKTGYFAYAPVLSEGRFELLNYLHEQSVTTCFHRYGNLGARKNG